MQKNLRYIRIIKTLIKSKKMFPKKISDVYKNVFWQNVKNFATCEKICR